MENGNRREQQWNEWYSFSATRVGGAFIFGVRRGHGCLIIHALLVSAGRSDKGRKAGIGIRFHQVWCFFALARAGMAVICAFA